MGYTPINGPKKWPKPPEGGTGTFSQGNMDDADKIAFSQGCFMSTVDDSYVKTENPKPKPEPPPNELVNDGFCVIPRKNEDQSFSSEKNKVIPKNILKNVRTKVKTHVQSGQEKSYLKTYKHKTTKGDK